MKCLTHGRYTMTATLLTQSHQSVVNNQNGSVVIEQDRGGNPVEVEIVQDPISGAVERDWQYASLDGTLATSDENLEVNRVVFSCSARGFTDGGLRLLGTDERWSSRGYIEHVDSVQLKFPARVYISDRDRVTLITSKISGEVLWREEDGTATVFEVSGVTPIFDALGRHIENSALVKRAQQQGVING